MGFYICFNIYIMFQYGKKYSSSKSKLNINHFNFIFDLSMSLKKL